MLRRQSSFLISDKVKLKGVITEKNKAVLIKEQIQNITVMDGHNY